MKKYTLLMVFAMLLSFRFAAHSQFATVTNLAPLAARVDATKEKQQAKVFAYASQYWSVISDISGGTHLWRLDGTTWTRILKLSTRNSRADCVINGNITHIFLYAGKKSELVSVEYVASSNTYQFWSKRKTKVDLVLDDGVETGSIALDATGRMWLASDANAAVSFNNINVRYSDAPYTSWSGPVTIATGVDGDDICAAIHMPAAGKVGVFWSNQKTKRFGFRTHSNGASVTDWSADEVPASQSVINFKKGMADDHMNLKIGPDGTLYAAVKTSYDATGYPMIALLIRRPSGSWDRLYEVDQIGTRPIVLLNPLKDKLKIIYTSAINGGDILYKESSMSTISFGSRFTLISGINNNVTSTHQNYSSDIVILASNTTQMVGVRASDGPVSGAAADIFASESVDPAIPQAGIQEALEASPNPFTSSARLSFALPVDGEYSLTLYDSKRVEMVYQKQGTARAGERNSIEVDAANLNRGIYFARLQTAGGAQTLRLVVDR